MLSEYIAQDPRPSEVYGPSPANECQGIQLSKAVGTFVADLLFSHSVGGIVQSFASAERLFASELFSVYATQEQIFKQYPKLLTKEFNVLLLSPPKSMKFNLSSTTWNKYFNKLLVYRPLEEHREQKNKE